MPPCTLSLKELKSEVCPAGDHLSLADTFSNSSVLITGATGYVGSLVRTWSFQSISLEELI